MYSMNYELMDRIISSPQKHVEVTVKVINNDRLLEVPYYLLDYRPESYPN